MGESISPIHVMFFLAGAIYIFVKDALPWIMGKRGKEENSMDLGPVHTKLGEIDTEVKLLKNQLIGMDGRSGILDDLRTLWMHVNDLRTKQQEFERNRRAN